MMESISMTGVMRSLRVLVCGGRDYSDRDAMFSKLDQLQAAALNSRKGVTRLVIIHGAAKGADSLAGEWAKSKYLTPIVYPADWNKHGNRAGPIRNQQMLDEGKPDVVVAFPGGTGTGDMVRRAQEAGVRLMDLRG